MEELRLDAFEDYCLEWKRHTGKSDWDGATVSEVADDMLEMEGTLEFNPICVLQRMKELFGLEA